MLTWVLENFGVMEVAVRCLFAKMPGLKNRAKRKISAPTLSSEYKPENWSTYKNYVKQLVGKEHIVLVHSSMDGFASMGISCDHILELFQELVQEKNTIVLPAFPVTNLKTPSQNSMPYDPKKTLCWTGLLPNRFIAIDGVVRSSYPFNSLAAIGMKAEDMMGKSFSSVYVYDKDSPWAYCVKNHAKILFLGTPAHSANTVAIHMVPDIMGDEWPIANWYVERNYRVRQDGEISVKKVFIQAPEWYKYCKEYETSRYLRHNGILLEELVEGCYLGYVKDAGEMVDALVDRCKGGKLMYRIPRKFYKRG